MSSPDVFESSDLYVGETRKKGITVALAAGESITSATWQVLNGDGTPVTSPASATIVPGTGTATVFAYVPAGSEVGDKICVFTYTIGSETLIAVLKYSVRNKHR